MKHARDTLVDTSVKVQNDNGVYPAFDAPPGNGSCDTFDDPAVMVDRAFREGGHSRSHALRFAAWLVHAADKSVGHGDFIAVLDAVEREDS